MPNEPFEHDDDGELAVEAARPKLKKPSMYKVLLLNDDFTPMDFVVATLKKFFHKDHEEAVKITMSVHLNGVGICGIFSKEIAETKVNYVQAYSQANQHPLQCTMEME
ncbi:MAG: ATP-dependent Clp protease adaptor ClpS [Cycloclasticus sp. symbiont of Poecilosclerida sp. M]|nr:MAG: ATP-dependent Clp protease adaptor ClpS [Cycloclasticus sp. symbiont of Poecilosclerida sp. M]